MNITRLLLVSLLTITSYSSGQTYRWVDENGVVSYSQSPPPGQDAEAIVIKAGKESSPDAAKQQLNSVRQQLEDNKEDRALAKEKAMELAKEKEVRKQNCFIGRSNLRNLEALGRRLLHTSDGQYIRLTEEQRQQRMQQAQDLIKENCTN